MAKQPIRKRKAESPSGIRGTGKGIKYCNECPFLKMNATTQKVQCLSNDHVFQDIVDLDRIPVPNWCGNKKKKNADGI